MSDESKSALVPRAADSPAIAVPVRGAPQAGRELRRILRPSWKRILLAFVVAAASDCAAFFAELVPPIYWALDIVTALLLFTILGRRWAILPGLIAEAIPGMGVFPVWMLVVAFIAAFDELPRRKR